jgi:hypothetical protein
LSSDVRLSIRDIRNANPVWLRSADNLYPLDGLQASIKDEGMRLPVLVRPDFVMLDGARRLLVAERLHWKSVPVTVANDWATVARHFKQVNKLEAEGLPHRRLTWVELDELWVTLLKPVHGHVRREQTVRERVRRAGLRKKGVPESEVIREPAYTGFVTDLAELFNMKPIHVKLIREIFHTYRELKDTTPEIVDPFEQLLARAEETGVETASTMRQFVRNVKLGTFTVNEAGRRAEKSLNNAFAAPWRLTRRTSQDIEDDATGRREIFGGQPNPPVTTLPAVQNLTKLLEQLSWDAGQFQNFGDIEPVHFVALASTIRTSVNRINAMRRRLEAHGATLQGEREQ